MEGVARHPRNVVPLLLGLLLFILTLALLGLGCVLIIKLGTVDEENSRLQHPPHQAIRAARLLGDDIFLVELHSRHLKTRAQLALS